MTTAAPAQKGYLKYNFTPYPRQVRIESSSACNMHCAPCSFHGGRNPLYPDAKKAARPMERIRQSLFLSVVQELSTWPVPLRELAPTNWGEWFMHPNWYEQGQYIERMLPQTGIALPTTGVLVTDKVIEQLASIKTLKYLNISVNAFFAETYERFHGVPATHLPRIIAWTERFRKLRPDVFMQVSMVYDPIRHGQSEMERDLFIQFWSPRVNAVSINNAIYVAHPAFPHKSTVTLPCRSIFDGLTVLADGRVVTGCCLLPEEQVLTLEGERAIKELLPGEQVLTDRGRWRSVVETMSRGYQGSILHVETNYAFGFRATPEHPVLTMDGWKEAAHLKVGDSLIIPVPQSAERKSITVAPHLRSFSASMRHRAGATMERRYRPVVFAGMVQRAGSSFAVRNEVALSPEFMYAMGLFLAEGWISFSGRNARAAYAFGKHERKLAEDVASIVEGAFGIHTYLKERRTTLSVHLSSALVGEAFLAWFGHGAVEKRVPPWVWEASDLLLWHFIRGYLDGDGSKDKNSWRGATVSPTLARQIPALISAIGGHASAYRKKVQRTTVIEGRSVRVHPVYEWHASGISTLPLTARPAFVTLPIARIDVEQYAGSVFNLEVAEDHTYVVGGFAVHNCFDAEGELAVGRVGEKSLLDIWRDEPLRKLGQLHNDGRRGEIEICSKCSFA